MTTTEEQRKAEDRRQHIATHERMIAPRVAKDRIQALRAALAAMPKATPFERAAADLLDALAEVVSTLNR